MNSIKSNAIISHVAFRILGVILCITTPLSDASAQLLSEYQVKSLARNFYGNCLKSLGTESKFSPLGAKEFCKCGAIAFSTNLPQHIERLLIDEDNTNPAILEREQAVGRYCDQAITKKNRELPFGGFFQNESPTNQNIENDPANQPQANNRLDGLTCTQDSLGLLRCNSGLVCQQGTDGIIKCNNGLTGQSDGSGLIRFNNGISATTDGGGLTRYSNGITSQTDSSGLTRYSDGTTCTRDELGLVRCREPYGRLK